MAQVAMIKVSQKPEVIGSFFEDAFRTFMSELLPPSTAIVPGFVVSHSGKPSSHFDGLIVDTTYPYLGSIGNHKYVAAPSVIAAIELTTSLDGAKLKTIATKARELETISDELFPKLSFASAYFYAIAMDSRIGVKGIHKFFKSEKPHCHLFTLRAPGDVNKPINCWMEGGRDGRAALIGTNSPLSDLTFMLLQDSQYCLGSRVRSPDNVGAFLNTHIYWGTAPLKLRARTSTRKNSKVTPPPATALRR